MPMTDEELAAVRLLSAAEKRHRTFGKPAVEVPLEAIHVFDSDGPRVLIDMEQIVFLAEDMLRKAPDPITPVKE